MVTNIYRTIMNSSSRTSNFAILKLFVTMNEWREVYEKKVEEHNNKFLNNYYVDSGFDVIVPNSFVFKNQFESVFVDMGIKTEMFYCEVECDNINNCAYVVHPRSSISKTPLMLANHTGIIDSGYRGSLIGAFRSFSNEQYKVEAGTRLLQICHPTLCPIYVVLADELSSTERGEGGFGSTGV